MAPLILLSSLGSWAFANASVVIHAVTASVPTIMNNGRGAIMAINRNASKLAMPSTLFQVKNLAERGCCARAVQ